MKRQINAFLVILFIAIQSTTAAGLEPTNESLFSKILNEQREIVIQLPKNYQKNTELKYPVLYLLDGPSNISHTASTLNFIHAKGMAPESIIVGIANTNRGRDLTPTPIKRGETAMGGGGDNFLDFIESELMPYIEKNYRTENFKMIAGHSLGGLLVIHSLQSRPHLFQAHFAFSPSLWWDDQVTVKSTKAFFTKTKALKNSLYMNLGNEDGDMKKAFEILGSFLQKNKPQNFSFKTELFINETHGTIPFLGQYHAYRDLFTFWDLDFSNVDGDPIVAIEKHMKALADHYGYPVNRLEKITNDAGYFYLHRKQDPKTAIQLFTSNTKKFPESSNAYDSLADAYDANGQIEKAIEQMNSALKLAVETDSNYSYLTEHKRRLQEKAIKQTSTK
jgi:predicted alpha/beta superfamily hydrolase